MWRENCKEVGEVNVEGHMKLEEEVECVQDGLMMHKSCLLIYNLLYFRV